MSTWRKQSIVFVVILVLLGAWVASPVLAEENQYQHAGEGDANAPAMMVDLALYRPVGIALTAVGAVFFVVSLPFTAAAGSIDEAGETLVREPFRFTFNRPLGAGILSSE